MNGSSGHTEAVGPAATLLLAARQYAAGSVVAGERIHQGLGSFAYALYLGSAQSRCGVVVSTLVNPDLCSKVEHGLLIVP